MLRILSLFTVCFFLNSCIVGVSGNGKVQEENRTTEEFNGIHASGMYEIHLVQDEDYRLKVVADENLLSLIRTEVNGGILEIRSEENIREAEALDIYISAPNIDEIDLSGAVELRGKGVFKGKELKIESSGAAQIDLSLGVDRLSLDLSGASEVKLSGAADRVRIESSGASEIKMFSLKAQYVSVDVSGASDLELYAEEELQIEASGASEIEYVGNARITRQNLSGASNVKKR